MPYIKPEDRVDLNKPIDQLAENIESAGDFNYSITRLLAQIMKKKGLRYSNLNEFIGALECVKLEFYRLMAVDYEENKKDVNGPVFNLNMGHVENSDEVFWDIEINDD